MVKVIRVVTSNYCVPAHLHNTLLRIPDGYQIYVVGDDVSKYKDLYQSVTFLDIPIRRNFSLFTDIYAFSKLLFFFNKVKPDIVHSLMVKAGLLAAFAGKLVGVKIRVHTFTGQVWTYKKGLSRHFLKYVDKLICFLNTCCLTDSPSQSNYLFINGIYKNKKPLSYIMKGSLSGVDLVRFNKERLSVELAEMKVALGLNDTDFILGYVARKSLDKGCIDILKILLKVIHFYSNVRLIYVGPDESNGDISTFFANHPHLSEYVKNVGFVHNHEHYLGVCNLLCLPSYREGFGSVVIDAAALGVPTIGYKIPGLVDSVINDLTGKLVKCGDIDDFAEVIIWFLKDMKILNEYSMRARLNAVNFFDADLLNNELYDIYNTLCEKTYV